ncbi:MAG: ABC transporter substrate-binding protein [Chloroflexi bacterium]|nr:ABC transporter substrate-binding protein [Chloroflexota bacterium]
MLHSRKTHSGILILFILAVLSVLTALPSFAQDDPLPVKVGVVIQGPEGKLETYCVDLDPEKTMGLDALAATGLEVNSSGGAMGAMVCRIDSVGCSAPDESCFCQCEGGNTCAYWSYFHLNGANWQYSPVGAAGYKLEQGAVEGWWWRDNRITDEGTLPVIPFEEICAGGMSSEFPRTVVDGLEREVVIPAPPQRIASLALGSDEILLSLVGADRLIGVTYLSSDSAVSNIAGQLDGIQHTDLTGSPEQLISLEADLVILAAYNDPAVVDQLLDADVPVFVLTAFNTLDDIRENIRLLGAATGTEQRAETMISEMDSTLADVQSKVAQVDPVRVLYYEPGGVTYGPGSTVDEIITIAGGVNVVSEMDLGSYPLINAEFVLAVDPDVILLGGWFLDEDDPLDWFVNDPVFSTLRAVQSGRVYSIRDAYMTNVSQYFVLGVEEVARNLYPDVFGEAAE